MAFRKNCRTLSGDPERAHPPGLFPPLAESSRAPLMNGLEWNGCSLLALRCTLKRIWLSETPPTFSLRKEVIQPQVLLRLPCYDFTPIMDHTLGRCPPCGSACRLLVQSTFVM